MLTRSLSNGLRVPGAPDASQSSNNAVRRAKGKGRAREALTRTINLPLDCITRILDYLDDVDLATVERSDLIDHASERRRILHSVMLTSRTWHQAAARRCYDVLDLHGEHQSIRAVTAQLHAADESTRARVRVIILDPALIGVSNSLVKVLLSLCPRVETIVGDGHFFSSLTSYPASVKRVLLGEAELVVAVRLLAGATVRHLSIEQCHRKVDGLTATDMDLSAAAAVHLERLEVSFAPDDGRSLEREDGSDHGDGIVETMPSTLEWIVVNGYRLKHLRLAGCGTRAINSALRKLNRIAKDNGSGKRADGLERIEIVVPARDKARQFVREINTFMPATLTDYVLHCATAFDAASVASDLHLDFFDAPEDDDLPALRRIVITTDSPDSQSDRHVARHLDLAFTNLQSACDDRGISLERPSLCAFRDLSRELTRPGR